MGLLERLGMFDPCRKSRIQIEKLQAGAAALTAERDAYLHQRDQAIGERNELLRQRDEALGERNEYLRQRDVAIGQVNEVLRQRDLALGQIEQLRQHPAQ